MSSTTEVNFTNSLSTPMSSPIQLARDTLLVPAALEEQDLDQVMDKLLGVEIDAADLYFQSSRLESWVLEDGILKVAYDKYDRFDGKFGHIFYEKPFSNYVIRVEYRFVGDRVPGGPGWAFRNSGFMIHGQSPESMRKDQNSRCWSLLSLI